MQIPPILRRVGVVSLTAVLGTAVIFPAVLWFTDSASERETRVDLGPRLGPDNPPSPDSFSPMRALGEQPAISDVELLPASEVEDRVEGDELVLGVTLDGQARAYPINMLTGPAREIFNDELAGRPIAATW